ncbi:hypothetical protein NDU88_000203 [Pleurodeles waltl]|uniref:Uncharacterized protein n=1 Tax=Pleurodeles waltl TaxID=8319 RepID=A0AAV7VXG0_PLEWA|nr:hypothetical protein NDU88_000203 [Pleurodeles waltl]
MFGPWSGLGGVLGREVVPFSGGGLRVLLEASEPQRDPAGPRESRGHGGGLDPKSNCRLAGRSLFGRPGWGWMGAPPPTLDHSRTVEGPGGAAT